MSVTDSRPATEPRAATASTAATYGRVTRDLPLDDLGDQGLAERGFIASLPGGQILGEAGNVVWDLEAFAFLEGPAPETVNPSLWRQARLNMNAGLFEVVPGIYQVRGFDLANVTFVRGETGWIVIDPLTCAETARAALELVREHVADLPVKAVIHTHSHVDHFGGVRGVADEADVRDGRVQIIAPKGFLHAAVSENVMAGNAMTRRATYMYGTMLGKGPRAHVDSGLGKGTAVGTAGVLAPTIEISETGTELTLDGVDPVFQVTPGTEAPAEMNFLFPGLRALCMAENCTATLHNLYTPRGAEVRDALGWSKYIHEAIGLFAAKADVLFASHHWPRWDAAEVAGYLADQRDAYRYLHDQTLRLANQGQTPIEIAEQLELPEPLSKRFYLRDYYGTVNHNVKAIYQRYLGWFDGNPARLHPLPPESAAARYVEYMGGAEAVLEKAKRDFGKGEYRWVAQVLDHVVFAEPEHMAARELLADALEQLGYQAESGPWRNFYLAGAAELRGGIRALRGPGLASPDMIAGMTTEMIFDLLGVRLNGPKAAGVRLTINWRFTDTGDAYTLGLSNGALHVTAGSEDGEADATVTLDRAALNRLLADPSRGADGVNIEGRGEALTELFGLLDTFKPDFPIVTP